MKYTKYITAFLLIVLLFYPLAAEKRRARRPMKEFTNQKSPSYVPIPYPKNRAEILTDFKYYVKTYCEDGKYHEKNIGNSPNEFNTISKELMKPDSKYRFGEIIKVINRRAIYPFEYCWLIPILDRNGVVIMRLEMLDSGLFGSASTLGNTSTQKIRKRQESFRKVHKENEAREILSRSLGSTINKNDIDNMERMEAHVRLGGNYIPLWVITMPDGHIYYYSIITGLVYEADRIIPWKKNKMGGRPMAFKVARHRDYISDSINDEIIVLKTVTNK
ncbi:MAG: hypothetical protein GY757_60300 [bacterium]|nr:hypothetical protein [bacterium]